MLLLCSFFRLKELFQVKDALTSSLRFLFFFFLKMPKNLGRSDDAKRRKKKKKRMAYLLITTALPGKFNIFVHQLSSTPIKNALLG